MRALYGDHGLLRQHEGEDFLLQQIHKFAGRLVLLCGCVGWLGFLAGYVLVQVVKLAHKRLDDRLGLTGRRLNDSHKVRGWQAKAQDALDKRCLLYTSDAADE